MTFLRVIKTLILLVSVLPLMYCQRHDVHEMMYQTLSGAAGCFRRMNGTHQFGCSSPQKGSFGVIQLIENEEELSFLLKTASAGPYMVVLSPLMNNLDVIQKLKTIPEKISGIVFTDRHQGEKKLPPYYSPDETCPNSAESSCAKENPWNPLGNKYIFTDWSVPMFLVTEKQSYDSIIDCYNKFNLPLDVTQESKPLCSLHMKSHMFAAVSSQVCLRRFTNNLATTAKFCDPIGSENVVLPLLTDSSKKKIILISSRIDSASLFDGIAPGAMSSVTGLVTSLTAASLIYKHIQNIQTTKDVLFVMFNGEAFDFIGSTRVVYDIENKSFITKSYPVDLEDIDLFLDISQIGRPLEESDSTTYVHSTKQSSFTDQLIQYGKSYSATFKNSSGKELPPTSLTMFAKSAPNMNGIVLTNYDTTFKTKYYSGYYDTKETIGYTFLNGSEVEDTTIQYQIASVAASLSSAVIEDITGKKTSLFDLKELVNQVDQLLYCYLVTRSCPLIDAVYPSLASHNKLPEVLPMYVGVTHATNYITKATGLLLSYMTSPRVNISKTECITDDPNELYSLLWLSGEDGKGVCLNTTLKFTPAVSPAFTIENYDWTSGQYPTWTESVWDENSLGMFLKPSKESEIKILLTGIVTFLSIFTSVFIIKKKSDSLFTSTPPTDC